MVRDSGTYVFLADWINNGNRSSDEALYVSDLDVLIGATLNLNGLHLYTYYNGIHRVMAGEGNLFGGGIIIDTQVVPLPAGAWLLGSGLLALIGLGRRRRKS